MIMAAYIFQTIASIHLLSAVEKWKLEVNGVVDMKLRCVAAPTISQNENIQPTFANLQCNPAKKTTVMTAMATNAQLPTIPSDIESLVTSWLANTEPPSPSAEKTNAPQPRTPPRSTSRSQASASTRQGRTGERGRPRKRRRMMERNVDGEADVDVETTSSSSRGTRTTISTSTLSVNAHRPILRPTPPSTRHRSASPTRKALHQLRLATPGVKVLQPDKRCDDEPAKVRALKETLVRSMKRGVIPRGLKVFPSLFPVSFHVEICR